MIRSEWSIHSVRSLNSSLKAVEEAFEGAETSERTQSPSRADRRFPLEREIKRICLELGAFFDGCNGFREDIGTIIGSEINVQGVEIVYARSNNTRAAGEKL